MTPVRSPSPRRRALLRAAAVLLVVCGIPACASAGPPSAGALDAEFALLVARPGVAAPAITPAWRQARRRLGELRREAEGAGPRTLRVRLALREPRTRQMLEARGAIAIAPVPIGADPQIDRSTTAAAGGALRMILLGPGGTTALDLWARGDRFRFAVPALDLLRRGDASTPRAALRGMPVDFLRWWLLHPAAGTLLWYERIGSTDAFVLRDGDAVVDLRVTERGSIGARRVTWAVALGQPPQRVDEEVVIADGLGCGRVRYAQASTGLLITVTCEGEERERAPDPRAFLDPDATPAGGDS